MARPASSNPTVKENFSGPCALLTLAKKVAAPKKAHGLWSQWICAAIREKLKREGHALPDEDVGPEQSEIFAKIASVLGRAPKGSALIVLEEIAAVLRKHERNAARRTGRAA